MLGLFGLGALTSTAYLRSAIHLDPIEAILLLLFLGLLVLSVVGLVLRWMLRPLRHGLRRAAGIGPDALDGGIEASELPAEVRPLVDAFNGALERLERAYEIERRLTADAAHEMRTPLAVLSVRLQRARTAGSPVDWPSIQADVDRMSRLINQMLDLARKEANAILGRDREEVNLTRTVREAAAAVLPLAEQAGRMIDVKVPPITITVKGHAEDLRDMVRNLVENAVLHGKGLVRVELSRRPPELISLTVSDQGTPPADAESLFERFRKGEKTSKGSGLGLAIVRQVARSHGGSVAFLDQPQTRIELLLPDRERPMRIQG